MHSMSMQDAYPSQAEGGLAGDVSASLKRALKEWDQRRYDGSNGFRYGKGNGLYKKARVTSRAEVTWNPKVVLVKAPKTKKVAAIKVPREKKLVKSKPTEAERQAAKQIAREKKIAWQRERRANEDPNAKQIRLEARRAAYVAKHGPLKNPWTKRPGTELTSEQKEARRQRVAAYSAAWRARMTPEQKAEYNRVKAAKKRKK